MKTYTVTFSDYARQSCLSMLSGSTVLMGACEEAVIARFIANNPDKRVIHVTEWKA